MEKIATDYTKVFSEMYEIEKHLPIDFRRKLPNKLIKLIEENRDINYEFKYDFSKPLDEQDICEETKDFLTSLYLVYYCDQGKKEEILSCMKKNSIENEKILKEKYSSENIFNNKQENTSENVSKINDEISIKSNDSMATEENNITIKKDSIFTKIINKIKGLFSKKD